MTMIPTPNNLNASNLYEALRGFSSNKEPSKPGLNVAIVGPKGAGKDTLGSILQKYGDFEHFNFANLLKETCILKYGLTYEECYDPALKEKALGRWPYTTPRKIMQDEAETSRNLYPDIWVKAWEANVEPVIMDNGNLLVTDLRYPNEFVTFRKLHNSVIIYILNLEVEEKRRQGLAEGNPTWLHESERHSPMLRDNANLLVMNNAPRSLYHLEHNLAYSLHIL